MQAGSLRVIDLGRMPYGEAYRTQCDHVEEVLEARRAGAPEPGRLLLVEHDPVITLGRRPGSRRHLIATPEMAASRGVEIVESDRGGDITYHGPGQLVAYPILDLNLLNLGLHDYMRLLEEAVIEVCGLAGLRAVRDPEATGVWMAGDDGRPRAKVCAMGVRVRKWVSMHGLALNVAMDLDAFGLIVPCGLGGRAVTSLEAHLLALGRPCPPIERVKAMMAGAIGERVRGAHSRAAALRAEAGRGDAAPVSSS